MGRQEGLDVGRQEGLAQGMRRVLKRLSVKRFGAAAPPLLALIDGAVEDDLDRLADLLMSAGSASEVVKGMTGAG